MLNIAVFASGAGTNFRAIQRAIHDGSIRNAKLALVISNNSDAGVLAAAHERGIPGFHISRKHYSTDEEFNHALLRTLKEHEVNFIVLAGYMKKIDSSLIQRFKNKIVNIHPALLPQFGGKGMYGMRVHEAVIAQHVPYTGVTVHLVDEEYDNGPVVLQRELAVAPDDTPETLAEKVQRIEHELYPEAIRLFAEGQIRIDGKHVTILTAQ